MEIILTILKSASLTKPPSWGVLSFSELGTSAMKRAESMSVISLLSWDVTKNRKMLQNIWQCQVTGWTITHSCAKYLKWKLPSDWETRDIPFHSRALQFEKVRLTELPDDKKESLIMLHMNKGSHFLNLDSSIGTEYATKIYLDHMAFHHFWARHTVITSSWWAPNLKFCWNV